MRGWVIWVLLAMIAGAYAAPPAFREEFVGPFASWKNVQTDYGAKGDGVADDTGAIQKALDDLRVHKDFCVLYFPAGTYRITNTVKTVRAAHHDCMGITVVGEDPETTVLKWDGADGGTLFKYDAWYSKISRLTLDGQKRAAVALAYGDAFSTYNETSDMVFTDVQVGMSMATGGNGQAENAVLRCRFLNCASAGIRTNNYNSLDIWAWYCRFEDCGYGMYNGAGNFHAYQCLFLRSKNADIGTANLMVFSFINNTSIGSKCFLDWSSGHSWGAPTTIAGNRIIDPTGPWALRLGNGGPYLVMDNSIRSLPDSKGPVAGMTWGDQTFLGNRYTVENPVKTAGRFITLDDTTVDPATIDATPPVLPPTPPHRARKFKDIPAGADAAVIQAAIDEAVKLQGQRPVLHFPKGAYTIKQTLVVPAGLDLQLIGDGASDDATMLQWAGPAGQPLLLLEGPSVASVRDMSINAGTGVGIRVTQCDQPGGRVYANQLNVGGTNPGNEPTACLLVDGVEQSDVQLQCLQGATFAKSWVTVLGGPQQQAGKQTKGQVSIFCGATGTADAQYTVARSGRLTVRSVYHEMSGDAPQGILLNDRGTLTIDATRFSYKTTPTTPLIKADGFKGQFTLATELLLPVNSNTTAKVEIGGDGAESKLLILNNCFWVNAEGSTADTVFVNGAEPKAQAALLGCNMNGNAIKGGFARLDERGENSPAFLRAMLQPLRDARVWLPGDGKPGQTNLTFHRVILTAGRGGVDVELRGTR